MSAATWATLILLGLIWGASFFFGRIAVQHVPPMTLVLLRVSLAALALHLAFGRLPGFYATLASRWPELLVLGLINNAIPFTLIFLGQTEIGAGLASILNATTPLWTVIIAQVLTTDEKISAAKLIGCALGLAGMVLLIGPAALGIADAPLWAKLAVVGAAVSYGFAAAFGKRFKGLSPRITATGQLTASSLIMLPFALVVDQPWTLPMPPMEVIAAILALALVSTAFAYVLYFRILSVAGATSASLVTLLVPPSAILLGIVFLGETLSLTEAIGLGLIALGLLSLDNRLAIKWK
ncbi:MAG: DMT family transporter [Hoeflea sp.]|nr:DMT family transporter [Alphaproteobacteria bacterium]MBV1722455.1 DMT family transporter [Hoeflea sp.]MBU4543189.1 DMT family transporter [Alphaproteobacteria bacterium]MBU4550271.1 DMT family transporter [Alphaproteobacteria bacterium]MBV1761605.1 DMT family transporter [Hoeflea sp.]